MPAVSEKTFREDMVEIETRTEPYICHGCGWVSSVNRTNTGQFLCNECLEVWEGGKFYPRPTIVEQVNQTRA